MGKDGENSATSWLKSGTNSALSSAKSSLSSFTGYLGNPMSRMFHQTVDPTVDRFQKIVIGAIVAGVVMVGFSAWRGRRETLLRKQHIKAMQDFARKMEEMSTRK